VNAKGELAAAITERHGLSDVATLLR